VQADDSYVYQCVVRSILEIKYDDGNNNRAIINFIVILFINIFILILFYSFCWEPGSLRQYSV
jgi:hypothetical protein